MNIELTKSEKLSLVRIGVATPDGQILIHDVNGESYHYYKPAEPIKKEHIGKKMKYQIVYQFSNYQPFAQVYKEKETVSYFEQFKKTLEQIFK